MVRSCKSCLDYHEEWDGRIFCGSLCLLFERQPGERFRGKSFFPYTAAPGCYRPNFWMTPFAEIIDGSAESCDNAWAAYDQFLREDGDPIKLVS